MAYNQLDIYIFVFFVIMAVLGYIKGFVTRLYDIVSLFIVLYLSYILSNPLSYYINISNVIGDDPIALLISQFTNQMITFVILFVVLFIIKKIIGILIKPLLNKVVKFFSLTSFINHLLGLILSVAEAFVLSYIAIVLLLSPIYAKGQTLVNESVVAQKMFDVMPTLSNNVVNLTKGLNDLTQDHSSSKDVMNLMLLAYDYNLINDEQVDLLVNNYIVSDMKSLTLNQEQYELFNEMLSSSSCDDKIKDKILKKVNVSDE